MADLLLGFMEGRTSSSGFPAAFRTRLASVGRGEILSEMATLAVVAEAADGEWLL